MAFRALAFMPALISGRNRRFTDHIAPGRRLPSTGELLHIPTTFAIVCIGWALFRAPDVSGALGGAAATGADPD